MKLAISVPDELFEAAERVAGRLKLSRSELYARALAAFLREHDGPAITRAIDRALAGAPSGVDPVLRRIQTLSLGRDEGSIEEWVEVPRGRRKRRGKRA